MSLHLMRTATIITSLGLALTACSSEPEDLPEPSVSASNSAVENTSPEAEAEQTYTDVPAETFKVDPLAYAFFGAASSERGCVVPTGEDSQNGPVFECKIRLDVPEPALADLGNPEEGNIATSVRYDPVIGFYTFSSKTDPFAMDAPQLNPGERVTLTDFTFTRVDDETLIVERGLSKITIKDGEIVQENPDPNREDAAVTSAAEGTRCGTVTSTEGPDRAVIALKKDTDCVAAMEVVNDYTSPNPTGGAATSTSLDWTAPNGWECARGHHPPGQPWNNINTRPVCKGDAGSVVIIEEDLL